MAEITVRYYAGARAAAGVEEEVYADIGSVADALTAIRRRHGALDRVLPACSLLLDGVIVHDPSATIRNDASTDRPESRALLDVLPPFAGG